MNLSQLEYLVAAYNEGSYANAAKALYISPQAVSKAIADLEKELSIELFAKSGRGVTPTANGAILASRAKDIVFNCIDFKNVSESLKAGDGEDSFVHGSLAVAVASSPYEGGSIPKTLFDSFAKQYSGVNLTVSYCSSGACLAALLEDVVEAAIILGRYTNDAYTCTKIYDSVLRVAVSSTSPLAQHERLTLNDIRNFPIAKPHDLRYCFRAVEKQFQKRDIEPRYVDVSPTSRECSHFLHEEGGLIFVNYEPSLEKVFDNARLLSLSSEDVIKIPVCYTYRRTDEKRLHLLLQQGLIKGARL